LYTLSQIFNKKIDVYIYTYDEYLSSVQNLFLKLEFLSIYFCTLVKHNNLLLIFAIFFKCKVIYASALNKNIETKVKPSFVFIIYTCYTFFQYTYIQSILKYTYKYMYLY